MGESGRVNNQKPKEKPSQVLENGIIVNWDFAADWPVDDNPTSDGHIRFASTSE
jgi:hypothetical protein